MLILVVLVLLVWGVLAQRERFDPATRDLPPAMLERDAPPITLYTPPLQRWRDPSNRQLSANGAQGQTHERGMFPQAVFDPPWQLDGVVRRFDPQNLYEKINGEAEKFIKRGFVAMSYAVLVGPEQAGTIAIELYDQGDIGGSSGVFASHLSGGRLPESSGAVSYVLTGIGVIGRVGRYFFRAAGDRESTPIQEKSRQLVQSFASLAQAEVSAPAQLVAAVETPPLAMQILTTGLGLDERGVFLQAENVFQYAFARDFWFAQLHDADAKSNADTTARVFLHAASSADAASALLAKLLDEHRYEYTPVEGPKQTADPPHGLAPADTARGNWRTDWHLMQHRYLGTHFSIARSGQYLFGVEKLTEAGEVEMLMQRFANVLERTRR